MTEKMDISGLKTLMGVFKIAFSILSLLTLILLGVFMGMAEQLWSGLTGQVARVQDGFLNFSLVASAIIMIASILGILFIIMRLYDRWSRLPWNFLELGYGISCGFLSFFSMAFCGAQADRLFKSGLDRLDRSHPNSLVQKAFTLYDLLCAISVIMAILTLLSVAYCILTFRKLRKNQRRRNANLGGTI